MNYAEDRLDRRARYQDGGPDDSGGQNATSIPTASSSTIASDLKAAHATLEQAGEALMLCAAKSTSQDTATHAFDLSLPEIMIILDQLRSGHELAGRSLRDCGRCREATHHYALAWMGGGPTNYSNCAGDYAQMTDLAGYSEIGILSLLYHRAGGQLDRTVPLRLALEAAERRRRRQGHTDGSEGSSSNDAHCGCHHPHCGSSLCHVVIPSDSPLLAELLSDLEKIVLDASSSPASDQGHANADANAKTQPACTTTTAADILEGLSKAAQAEKINRKKCNANGSTSNKSSSTTSLSTTDKNSFLPPLNEMPPNLRFWEDALPAPTNSSEDAAGREFPPLLQILLLKLLYASPVGGPFLQLACEAVPHLSVQMPLSSPLGQQMARDYKSHFAYYILIRAVVLGERVKKHRRGTAVPYHVPVWDVVNGVDQREVVAKVEGASASTEVASPSFSTRMQALLADFSTPTDHSASTPSHVLPFCLPAATSHPPLFVLGDSHCLSIAWQTIKISTSASSEPILRTLVPYPATGIKAWHVREDTPFFTHCNLLSCLQRLPPACRTVLLSAGEIDCREGIGGEKLSGYYVSCDDAVRNTVREYINAVIKLSTKHNLQVLLMPVAPHAFRNAKKGKAAGRDQRRERILLWNDLLREECAKSASNEIFLLDYERDLRTPDETSPVGFVLNKAFNADYTHLNSAFLNHLETALTGCIDEHGCRIELM
mmetsp:Transcript_16433/g.47188  ORF Transcript_16433/g.47188 Transcript_16433/m.47188 type:complete len:716 (+) Transcript_16433:62-2209(+)